MTSFLLSTLATKFRGKTVEEFRRVHECCWLVWEPGVWKPPAKSGETVTVVRLPTPTPSAGEALALALTPRTPGSAQVTLGRASTNDVEINDATLSQTHLMFMERSPGLWTVRDAGSKNGSWLDGFPLAPGKPHPLVSGARLQVAQVCITFYDPAGLFVRLASWAPAATTPARLLTREL